MARSRWSETDIKKKKRFCFAGCKAAGKTKQDWHGASPTTAMTHIPIVENQDGKGADWMEKVSDEQYQAETGAD